MSREGIGFEGGSKKIKKDKSSKKSKKVDTPKEIETNKTKESKIDSLSKSRDINTGKVSLVDEIQPR